MSEAQFHPNVIRETCVAQIINDVLPMRLPHPHDRTWGRRSGATYVHTRKPGLQRFQSYINMLRYIDMVGPSYILSVFYPHSEAQRLVLVRYKRMGPDETASITPAQDGLAWLRPVVYHLGQQMHYAGNNVHPAVIEALKLTQPRSYRELAFQYPRLSVEAPGMLIYNSCYDKLVREQYTRTSPGKYLRSMFPALTDTEIRDIVARTSTGVEFGIDFTMEGIIDGIERGPKSCMRGFDKAVHPYRVYDPAHGWGMAYRRSTPYECETCRAPHFFSRALVNRNSMTFVRSYKYGGNPDSYSQACEGLEAWLKTQGYTKAADWGTNKLARIAHPSIRDAVLMPYVDGCEQTLYEGNVDYFTVNYTHETPDRCGTADRTGGFITPGDCDDDGWECASCGEMYHDDDDRYWRGRNGDEPICNYCYDNYHVTAYGRRGCQYIVHGDYATYCEDDGEYYVNGCFADNDVVKCYHTDELRKWENTFSCDYDDERYGDECDHITMPSGAQVFRDNVEDYFSDDWDRFIAWWEDQTCDYHAPINDWAQQFIDACEDGDYDLDDNDDAWATYEDCCARVKHEPKLKRDDEEDEETTEE